MSFVVLEGKISFQFFSKLSSKQFFTQLLLVCNLERTTKKNQPLKRQNAKNDFVFSFDSVFFKENDDKWISESNK